MATASEFGWQQAIPRKFVMAGSPAIVAGVCPGDRPSWKGGTRQLTFTSAPYDQVHDASGDGPSLTVLNYTLTHTGPAALPSP